MRQISAVHHRCETGVDAGLGLQELLPRQTLDVRDAIAREAQLLEKLIRRFGRIGLVDEAQCRSALHRRAMKQAPGGRRRQQRRGLGAAA
jgi:hypothetical protein